MTGLRVPDGTFHDFHVTWIAMLKHTLNKGVLPRGYYAMAEQVAGGMIADVLTLQEVDEHANGNFAGEGGTAVATRSPQVSISAASSSGSMRRR